MRINSIQCFQKYTNVCAGSVSLKEPEKNINKQNNLDFLPLNNNSVYFAGKISTNREHRNYPTVTQLSLQELVEHMEKSNFVMPERVVKCAKETLAKGNPDNLTIYDIHKRAYERLNEFDPSDPKALDKIKEEFPEFKDVVSAYDVPVNLDCALDLANKGQTSDFKKPGDAAVKFLQAYYADLKSTEQISWMLAYTSKKTGRTRFGNANLLFKQLSIPTYSIPYSSIVRNAKRLSEAQGKKS